MAGTREQLAIMVDTLHELGPATGLVLSTLDTKAKAKAKTTVLSRLQLGEIDPLNKGIPRVKGPPLGAGRLPWPRGGRPAGPGHHGG